MTSEAGVTPLSEQGVVVTAQSHSRDLDREYLQQMSLEDRRSKEKALVRKIDARLLPILLLMYVSCIIALAVSFWHPIDIDSRIWRSFIHDRCHADLDTLRLDGPDMGTTKMILNYLDRNALPQAQKQGLSKELGLTGNQYNTVLSLTFVGYILGQVPSNMIVSNLRRPSIYLSAVMVAWGTLSGLTGATRTFGEVAACRFLLGLCEAPFFPGVAFLFSGWYTRKELGKRLGFFFCGSMIAGAFGGVISAGIAAAFRGNPISSWRWMFIIEGSLTVAMALLIAFIIPDWPATTKWLSKEEKALGKLRLEEDNADQDDSSMTAPQALRLALKDSRVWLCIAGQICMQAVASLTNFLPSLVEQFGHDEVITLLLTSPPYVAAAIYTLIACTWSDSTSKRSPFIVFATALALIGVVITLATTNPSARYAALFLMLPGTYGSFQISNAWMANIAAQPAKKRGISLALNNAFGNSALVWTPYLYNARMGPDYTLAWSVNLGLLIVLMVSTIVLSLALRRANKRYSGKPADCEATNISSRKTLRDENEVSSTGFRPFGSGKTVGREEGKSQVTQRYDT